MPDCVTAINFDNAVMTLGVWVENKLSERDPDTHQSIYTLNELLGIEDDRDAAARKNMQQIQALSALMRTSIG